MAKTYYDILEITPQASDEDIRRAYRDLAMRFHPDRNPRNRHFFENRFRLINEAYFTLRSSEKRALYNRTLVAENDNLAQQSWLERFADMFRPFRYRA